MILDLGLHCIKKIQTPPQVDIILIFLQKYTNIFTPPKFLTFFNFNFYARNFSQWQFVDFGEFNLLCSRIIAPAMKHLFVTFILLMSVFLSSGGQEIPLRHIAIDDSVTSGTINSMVRSHDGFLWIATDDGLYRYDGYETRAYLPGRKIEHLFETHLRRLWINTGDSWVIHDPATDTLTHNADSLLHSMGVRGRPLHIDIDRKSSLWIFTDTGEIFHIPTTTSKAIAVDFGDFPSAEGKNFTSFADSGRSTFAITDNGEIYEISQSTHRVERYDSHIPDTAGKESGKNFKIFHDLEGLIWIFDSDRIWLYDSNHRIWNENLLPGGGKSTRILTIFQGSDLKIRIGREGHGLETVGKTAGGYAYIPATGRDDMFPADATVTVIDEDNDGSLWIGAGKDGVYVYDNSAAGNTAPRTILTSVSVNGADISVEETAKGLSIPTGTKDLTVKFASNNITDPYGTRFSYRLNGFDEDWKTLPQGVNIATYTNLPDGDYTLAVRATDRKGRTGLPATLHTEVRAPFYLTTAAYVIYTIILIALIAAAITGIFRRERRRAALRRSEYEAAKDAEFDRRKRNLLNNIDKDFRSPLRLVIPPIDAMLNETTDDTRRMRLSLIRRNAGILLDKVDRMIDFNRAETSGLRIHNTQIDLATLISGICDTYKTRTGPDVTYHSDIKSLSMFLDGKKISRVMTELIDNAVRFTPADGHIEVSLSVPDNGENVVVSVADTGCGMGHSDREEGYGIGLRLVKDYIRLHEGSMEVRDNTPVGTVVELTLPLRGHGAEAVVRKADISTPAVTDEENTPPPSGGYAERPLALVIDDDTNMLHFLKDGLSDSFNVFTATDGEAAMSLLSSFRPSVIITEADMCGMDGTGICRRLKDDPVLSGIPVIALTATTDVEARVAMLLTDADDYITKPFGIDTLLSRARHLVAHTTAISGRRLISPESGEISPADSALLAKVVGYIAANLSSQECSVEEISSHLGISRVHLYKKLKSITGKTPVEFIRLIRLKRAVQLLRDTDMNVSEVAAGVGFNTPKYFVRYFKEEFNMLPSDYREIKG